MTRYSIVAIVLHWLIAVAIFILLGLGFYMTGLPDSAAAEKLKLYQLHKSIGITVLVLSLCRLGWRLMHRPPPLPEHLAAWEKVLARLTHGLFYVLMIVLPLSGWAMVSASPWNLPTVLYGVLDWPHLPYFSTVADKKTMEALLKEIHEILAFGTIGLIGVHMAGALKHHFMDRDDVLARMLPFVKQGKS